LQLFAYALYDNGRALNEGIADTLQGISNIEATRAFRMYEAWAQWQAGDAFSLRAGLYDLNSEFDSIEAAGLFINPSHGIGPDLSQTGLNGPSIFPVTSIGVRAQLELDRWQVRLAVLDAVPGDPARPNRTAVRWDADEGLLYISELDYRTLSDARVGVGYWRYSETFETLAPVEADEPATRARNDGSYVFMESAAFVSSRGEARAYARAGWANPDINTIGNYIGTGVTWRGFARSEDQIGFAVARARVGEPWRRAQRREGVGTEAAEWILEMTARMPVGEYVIVQPDVQYIEHAGALSERKAFWALGLRLEMGFAFAR
jgi:porin